MPAAAALFTVVEPGLPDLVCPPVCRCCFGYLLWIQREKLAWLPQLVSYAFDSHDANGSETRNLQRVPTARRRQLTLFSGYSVGAIPSSVDLILIWFLPSTIPVLCYQVNVRCGCVDGNAATGGSNSS